MNQLPPRKPLLHEVQVAKIAGHICRMATASTLGR